MDDYLAPDHVHRLHEALCDLYCAYIERAVREFRPDGFWTSDDLRLFLSTPNRPPEAALCLPTRAWARHPARFPVARKGPSRSSFAHIS